MAALDSSMKLTYSSIVVIPFAFAPTHVTLSISFKTFCEQHPFWSPLLRTVVDEGKRKRELTRAETEFAVGDTFYQDLATYFNFSPFFFFGTIL